MGSRGLRAIISLQLLGFSQWSLASEIHHEFLGSLSYNQSSGSTSTQGSSSTDAKQTGLNAVLGYGYIFSNWSEALIELDLHSEQRKIAEFSDGRQGMNLGVGLLFNIPMDSGTKKDAPVAWIPFGGIVMSQINQKNSKKTGVESNYDQQDMVTQFVIGSRYFIFPNVALHTSLRASFKTDTVTEKAENGAEQKASSNQLQLELRLLSLAVLI